MIHYTNVDAYIAAHPKEVQSILKKMRKIIQKVAPSAEEKISYGMPGYKLNGKVLVYFAAQKKHIGFYATPSGNSAFKKELSTYVHGKGSIQFPLGKPIPYVLVEKMVKFKVKEIKSSFPSKK